MRERKAMGKHRRATALRGEKERLENELHRTLEHVMRLKASLKSEMERAGLGEDDAGDVSAEIYEREKTLALIRTLEEKVRSLEHALQLADAGSYGICERCGERIDPGRLEIVPQATLCVKCQREVEFAFRPLRRLARSRSYRS